MGIGEAIKNTEQLYMEAVERKERSLKQQEEAQIAALFEVIPEQSLAELGIVLDKNNLEYQDGIPRFYWLPFEAEVMGEKTKMLLTMVPSSKASSVEVTIKADYQGGEHPIRLSDRIHLEKTPKSREELLAGMIFEVAMMYRQAELREQRRSLTTYRSRVKSTDSLEDAERYLKEVKQLDLSRLEPEKKQALINEAEQRVKALTERNEKRHAEASQARQQDLALIEEARKINESYEEDWSAYVERAKKWAAMETARLFKPFYVYEIAYFAVGPNGKAMLYEDPYDGTQVLEPEKFFSLSDQPNEDGYYKQIGVSGQVMASDIKPGAILEIRRRYIESVTLEKGAEFCVRVQAPGIQVYVNAPAGTDPSSVAPPPGAPANWMEYLEPVLAKAGEMPGSLPPVWRDIKNRTVNLVATAEQILDWDEEARKNISTRYGAADDFDDIPF